MAQCSDLAIAAAIDHAARYLGIAIANVVTAFHPDLIVLGCGTLGGLALAHRRGVI